MILPPATSSLGSLWKKFIPLGSPHASNNNVNNGLYRAKPQKLSERWKHFLQSVTSRCSVFQSSYSCFFFLGEKNAIISECHSEKAVCCSTGPMPRIVSSVEITRISWADSLIGTSAWHSSALCGFCRYIHYELELQDRNTVYLLKRTPLTTIFYYLVVSLENVSVYHWESRCK